MKSIMTSIIIIFLLLLIFLSKMDKFVLSFLVGGTLARLDSLITDEPIISSNMILRDELRRLENLLIRCLNFLLITDVWKKRIGIHNVSSWINKLNEVVYKADETIDELVYVILRPKVTLFNFVQNLIFNTNFAAKVRILNDQLLDMTTNPEKMKHDGRITPPDAVGRVTYSVLDYYYPLIGRDSDAFRIVNLLTRSSDQRVLTVVPIVGMDGLGKTALAKFVFQRVMALELCDVKMWVCVSGKCDEENILGRMLRSLNATIRGLTGINVILEQLEKELRGKSFLLVLDDVCEDVCRWWGDFSTWLLQICSNSGNVVLVTTQSEEVASIVETSSHHRHTLGFLSDDECWFILKERAGFRIVDAQVQSNLEDIGRDIAKECRGVPLAAIVLGGMLRFERDEESWLRIRDSRFSKSRDIEESVKSILKISFGHLPSSLKQCFRLCSVFPKGFSIIKEDLIQLWTAERSADPCDLGNACFYALLAKSFFQDTEFDDEGNVINCKMHNLVHDLALLLEKSETHIHYLNADYQYIRTSEALPKNKAKYLTTIILNNAPFQRSWNPKSLRTLYLNDADMEKLPSTVNKLKHFRYLHVSNTKTSPLLKSITNIYMLQILTLSNCICERLPLLGHLPCLRFLKISHMERVKFIGNEPYEGNSRRHESRLFPALKSLSLSWMENLTAWTPPSHANGVVMFPLLEYLSIQSCDKLIGFPMRYLSALVKLELKDCVELRFIFDEIKSFPAVTSLSIVGCPKLTYLRNLLLSNESYKEFRVRRCEWLKFIPEDLAMQRSLVSLHICCCKGLGFFSEEILCKLTRLRRLSIGAFQENLDDFCYLNRIKELTCLEELEIWGSDIFGRKMSALPNQLQHLPRLKSLKIRGFTTMEALPEWLPNIQYLETISLNYCWHLKYQSTAATIQRLPYLSQVRVSGCHALEEHKSQWMEFSGTTNIRILFQ